MQLVPATGGGWRSRSASALHDRDADQPRDQHPARHAVLLAAGRAVRRHLLRARELQRRRKPRRPLEGGAPGPRRGRVHRRHPVPRDAELREADPRTAEDYRRLYGEAPARRARRAVASLARGKASAQKPRSKKAPRVEEEGAGEEEEGAATKRLAVEGAPPPDVATSARGSTLTETTRSRTASFAHRSRAAAGAG